MAQFYQIITPFCMCLILQIIRSTMGYRGKLSVFSPSQSSHTILSVSHRCNFLAAKMHQKSVCQNRYNLQIINKIIIICIYISLPHNFLLECFFSIFSFLRCRETQRWLLNNLWSHHYEGAVTVVEEFLSECLNIIGGYAFEDAEILVFVVVTLVVVA